MDFGASYLVAKYITTTFLRERSLGNIFVNILLFKVKAITSMECAFIESKEIAILSKIKRRVSYV